MEGTRWTEGRIGRGLLKVGGRRSTQGWKEENRVETGSELDEGRRAGGELCIMYVDKGRRDAKGGEKVEHMMLG